MDKNKRHPESETAANELHHQGVRADEASRSRPSGYSRRIRRDGHQKSSSTFSTNARAIAFISKSSNPNLMAKSQFKVAEKDSNANSRHHTNNNHDAKGGNGLPKIRRRPPSTFEVYSRSNRNNHPKILVPSDAHVAMHLRENRFCCESPRTRNKNAHARKRRDLFGPAHDGASTVSVQHEVWFEPKQALTCGDQPSCGLEP